MQELNTIIKALFLGFTGTGIPLSLLIYTVYTSVKNGKKVSLPLFWGHLIAELFLIAALMLGMNIFVENAVIYLFVNLFSIVVSIFYSIKLSLGAFRNADTITLKNKYTYDEVETDENLPLYSDISGYSETINDKDKKTEVNSGSYKSKAFFSSILFTASSFSFISFVLFSVPSIVFSANNSSIFKNMFLTSITFMFFFILAEFMICLLLPRVIAIFRKFISPKTYRIIVYILSLSFVVLSIFSIINTINGLKYL